MSNVHLQGEFVEDGTETHFTLGDHNCCVKAVSSGKRRDGIIHTLIVDGTEIAECTEWLCVPVYTYVRVEIRFVCVFWDTRGSRWKSKSDYRNMKFLRLDGHALEGELAATRQSYKNRPVVNLVNIETSTPLSGRFKRKRERSSHTFEPGRWCTVSRCTCSWNL